MPITSIIEDIQEQPIPKTIASSKPITLHTYTYQTAYNKETNEIYTSNKPLESVTKEADILAADYKLPINAELAEFTNTNINVFREIGPVAIVNVNKSFTIWADTPVLQEILRLANLNNISVAPAQNCGQTFVENIDRVLISDPNEKWSDYKSFSNRYPSGEELRMICKDLRLQLPPIEDIDPNKYNFAIIMHEATHAKQNSEPTVIDANGERKKCLKFIRSDPALYAKLVSNPDDAEQLRALLTNNHKLMILLEVESMINELNIDTENKHNGYSKTRYVDRLLKLTTAYKTPNAFTKNKIENAMISLFSGFIPVNAKPHINATPLLILGEKYFDPTAPTLINTNQIPIQTSSNPESDLVQNAKQLSGFVGQKLCEAVNDLKQGIGPQNLTESFYTKVTEAIRLKALEITDTAQNLYLAATEAATKV
jgi:hypothetical protein